ncbi:hypothetical protein AB6846_22270 [Serratia proteamaculans]
MYLSSLPQIAREYQSSFASVQLTLMFSPGYGAGQSIFGSSSMPMADAAPCWPACCCLPCAH